jgi:hypothetical protein
MGGGGRPWQGHHLHTHKKHTHCVLYPSTLPAGAECYSTVGTPAPPSGATAAFATATGAAAATPPSADEGATTASPLAATSGTPAAGIAVAAASATAAAPSCG